MAWFHIGTGKSGGRHPTNPAGARWPSIRLIIFLGANALGLTAGTQAAAQNFSFLFPSPDQVSGPAYPAATVNDQAPIASINAVTGFGRTFGFGSSSTDTRSSTPVLPGYGAVWSNGNANYIELLAPIIGASDVRGKTVPLANPAPTNFAVAGTNSLTAQPQVNQFQAAYGRFSPNDIAVMWSGINDFNAGGINPGTFANVAAADVTNQTVMVRQLIGLGARNLVVIGQTQLGTFSFFTNPVTNGTNDPASLNAGAMLVNQGLLSNLATIHDQTGANVHFFDANMLVNEIRSNPTAYGFTAAGVQPLISCVGLFNLVPGSCPSGASFAVQNQYLSWDGIHYTYRFHELMSLAIANQLLAPFTIAPQAEIAESSAVSFANSLLGRLDAIRFRSTEYGSYATANHAYAMSTKAPPSAAKPNGSWDIFAIGTYASANQNDRPGAVGYDNNTGGGTIGFDYKWNPNLLVGGAFGYSDTNATTNFGGNISTDVNAYQFAGFASWNYRNWFDDILISGGLNSLKISRPGLLGNLTASPSGHNLVAVWKGGYLFDTSLVRLGPIGGLAYSKVWIDAYNESGDPLLTQAVSNQQLDGLTGSFGVQFRLPASATSGFKPYLNLTVEHDFIGDARVVTTAQTYAIGLPIATQITNGHSNTYGKAAGGAFVDLGRRLSATFNAESTFARQGGNLSAVSAGLNLRL